MDKLKDLIPDLSELVKFTSHAAFKKYDAEHEMRPTTQVQIGDKKTTAGEEEPKKDDQEPKKDDQEPKKDDQEPKKDDASGEADVPEGPPVKTRPADAGPAEQPGVGGGNKDKLTGPKDKASAVGGDPKKERNIISAVRSLYIAQDPKANPKGIWKGEGPPGDKWDGDVCKLTVPGGNLFCKKNHKIKRKDMPQLKSTVDPNKPMADLIKHFENKDAGTTSVKIPGLKEPLIVKRADIDGNMEELNAEKLFAKYLKQKFETTVSETKITNVSDLKATQSQLGGKKIAMFANALAGRYDGKREDGSTVDKNDRVDADGKPNPPGKDGKPNTNASMKAWVENLKKPIIVSRDGYILDGHHRWAALVQHDLANGGGGDVEMQVKTVDMGAIQLVKETNKFTEALGLETAALGEERKNAEKEKSKNESFIRLSNLVKEILSSSSGRR
jgi:hypothetical protein